MSDLLPKRLNKEDIVRQLREMIDHHLSGSSSWPADEDSVKRFHHFVEQHGLLERAPGTDDRFRETARGVDCGPLAACCIGALDPIYIPERLLSLGLISLKELEAAYSLPEDGQDYLQCVEQLVRKVYSRSGISIAH